MARPRQPDGEYLTNKEKQLIWWDDLPIKVYFDLSSMSEEQIVLSRLAFQIWNSAIGEEVFSVHENWVEQRGTNQDLLSSIDTKNSIFVEVRHIHARFNQPQRLGYCQYSHLTDRFGIDRNIHSVRIILHDKLPWEEIVFVTLHEAGHALGLRHDTNRRSIMFRAPLVGGMEIEERDLEYIRSQITMMRMRQNGYREVY